MRHLASVFFLIPLLPAQAVWTQLQPTTSPPKRTEIQLQSDGAGALMFAGLDGTLATAYNDLWRFDGVDWTLQLPVGAAPPPRSRFAAAFDPIRQRYVVFGGDAQYVGGGAYGDTWEWDPNTSTWTQFTPTSQPSARVHARMAFDLINANVLLFGGRGAGNSET